MTTIQAPEQPATIPANETNPILLHNVSWEAYEALVKSWAECHLRLTYDQGRLEIMSPLPIHERCHGLLGRLIEAYTFELDIPILMSGSSTFKQEAKKKGLEPDESYWVQNVPRMRGREEDYDPDCDPPPDLAIEVDITSSSLNRMSIYANLGVQEIWRYKDGEVTIWLLRELGEYEAANTGKAFPELPAEVITHFLQSRSGKDDTQVLKAFVQWIRELKGTTSKKRSRKKK